MKVLIVFALTTGFVALANEPESPGIPATCKLTSSTMDQRVENKNGETYTKKTISLSNFSFTTSVPGLNYELPSVQLSGGMHFLDGEHFTYETPDNWIVATVKAQVVSGRVTLDTVRVMRGIDGRMRKFDCKVVLEESAKPSAPNEPPPNTGR